MIEMSKNKILFAIFQIQITRPSDEGRRRSGVFYAGHGRRSSINCGWNFFIHLTYQFFPLSYSLMLFPMKHFYTP